MMTADLGDTAAEAARLALKIYSAAADAVSFVADLGEELPLVQPVLGTLRVIREKVDTAKSNPEELAALHQRCAHITACFVVKCRRCSSELDVGPLVDCIDAVEKVVGRCSRRGLVSRVLKASSDKDEILRLKERIGDLEGDLSLAGIAMLVGGGVLSCLRCTASYAIAAGTSRKMAISSCRTCADVQLQNQWKM